MAGCLGGATGGACDLMSGPRGSRNVFRVDYPIAKLALDIRARRHVMEEAVPFVIRASLR